MMTKCSDGYLYDTKEFDEYLVRVKVRVNKPDGTHSEFDVYTDQPERNKIQSFFDDLSLSKGEDVEITHYSTKENDIVMGELITETLYPSGTVNKPIDNFKDALKLAEERGIKNKSEPKTYIVSWDVCFWVVNCSREDLAQVLMDKDEDFDVDDRDVVTYDGELVEIEEFNKDAGVIFDGAFG